MTKDLNCSYGYVRYMVLNIEWDVEILRFKNEVLKV